MESDKKYRIMMAQFVSRTGEKACIPYGDGFGVDDLEEYRHKFISESGCRELRLTYEERDEV